MLAVSLNICNGGGRRVQSIVDWVAGKRADVIVLSEWRSSESGMLLTRLLEEIGYSSVQLSRLHSTSNGLLVAAKEPFVFESQTPAESDRGELLFVQLRSGVHLLASYFPQGRNKELFFKRCVAAAGEGATNPFLIIGDLNTGLNDLDVEGNGTKFYCADLFAALPASGLVDLWRLQNGERRDWSWRSRINGFRIDHAFANEAFRNRYHPVLCWLDHEPRIRRLTDHSAIFVSWSDLD